MAYVPPKLGPFEPLHRLGAGGMAETFLAVRRGPAGFEQRVCIKRILPAYESDKDFVESFLAEARTSAGLRHANIVQVVDFGVSEEDGSHYLALELVDGMDLRALMQREQVFDAEVVTLIATELASALAYAHATDDGRAPVVHRDLSPSNVLISRAGEVKLTDFGIARVIGGAHNTASGVIKGKVPYMPPEYIESGVFDTRGDLFSLGVMLFELCHGRRPFDGGSELDTMRRIAAGERLPFEASAPASFIAVVDRLLSRQPDDRFPDALAVLDALPPLAVHATRKRLAGLVRGRPSVTPPDREAVRTVASPPRPVAWAATAALEPTRTAPRSSTTRRRKVALLALGAALAVLAAVVGVLLVRQNHAPDRAALLLPPALPSRSADTTGGASTPSSPERDDMAATPDSTGVPLPGALLAEANEPATKARPVVLHGSRSAAEATDSEPRTSSNSAAKQQAELRVVVYPFGDVWLDGKFVGQSPTTLKVAPGTHEVGAGEGRERERRSVKLRAGESESVTFRRAPTTP